MEVSRLTGAIGGVAYGSFLWLCAGDVLDPICAIDVPPYGGDTYFTSI